MVPSRARRSTISSWSLTSPSFFVLDVRSLGPDADDDGAAPFATLANSAVGVMVSGEPPGGDPRSPRGGSGVPLMSRDARGETGGGSEWARTSSAFKTIAAKAEKGRYEVTDVELFAFSQKQDRNEAPRSSICLASFWIVHASRVRFISLKFSEVRFF